MQPALSAGAWPSASSTRAMKCAAWCAIAGGPRTSSGSAARCARATCSSHGACRARAPESTSPTTWCTRWAAAGATTTSSRTARARSAFAQMARREGIGRVVYLGGLGDNPRSDHLRSRHETAQTLAAEGPPLTYLRAAMVVGARERVVSHAALPGGAPACDDRAGLAVDRDAADRRRRRALLHGAGAGRAGLRRPRDPDRRPRRSLLWRHARPHGRRARAPPPAEGARARS